MKKVLKSLIVFIIISILVAYSNISMAANINDLKNEKNSVKNKITSTEKKIDEISKNLEKLIDSAKTPEELADYEKHVLELQKIQLRFMPFDFKKKCLKCNKEF